MKVKVNKTEYVIKDINLAERCELNDLVISKSEKPTFSMWVKVLQLCTDLSDEQINCLESKEIISHGLLFWRIGDGSLNV